MKFSMIFVLASVMASCIGCGPKPKFQRNYNKESLIGAWQAQTASIRNPMYPRRQIQISIPRYGSISCQINSDNTFILNVAVDRDVVLDDDQSLFSLKHVLVHAGYKVFIAGTYEYRDSTADFYNYDREKHFRSVLYTYAGKLYFTYSDEKQNEWKLQFEREN